MRRAMAAISSARAASAASGALANCARKDSVTASVKLTPSRCASSAASACVSGFLMFKAMVEGYQKCGGSPPLRERILEKQRGRALPQLRRPCLHCLKCVQMQRSYRQVTSARVLHAPIYRHRRRPDHGREPVAPETITAWSPPVIRNRGRSFHRLRGRTPRQTALCRGVQTIRGDPAPSSPPGRGWSLQADAAPG